MSILKIESLTKNFGGLKALDNCSIEIQEGKITALIGPNGSGKSTLFNIISRLEKQDNGNILFKEENLANKQDFEIAKIGISRTFQSVKLFRNLTIKEHLEIAMSEKNEKILQSLFRKEENKEDKIKELLEAIGLDKNIETYASELSYGQRKLLELALTLAKPHKILMLDEPVAGVNPYLRTKIKSILKSLNKKGETIILIEHDMNFVMNLADYLYVLNYGKVIAQGKPLTIRKNKKVLEAYLGE